MDDAISRRAMQEIVDRIGGMYPYRQIGNRESYSSYNEAWTDCINRVDAELNSLPSAEPETCEGCKHLGKWENEVEYGYPSPCTRCKRRVEDHYER